jgi:hypothetical protein
MSRGNEAWECGNAQLQKRRRVMDQDYVTDCAYGHVVSTGEATMTILEYDFESDRDVQVHYVIDAQTKFERVSGVTDIRVHDEVEILYKEVDAQRVAVTVSRSG